MDTINEITPLLGKKIDENETNIETLKQKLQFGTDEKDVESDVDSLDLLEEVPEWTMREIVVTFLSMIAVCVTIDTVYVSAVTDSYIWEDIFAGLSLLIPMYVAFQEQKVTESKAVKKSMNRQKEVIIDLEENNKRLTAHVDKLQGNVSKIAEHKELLSQLSKMEATALDSLEESLLEQKEIEEQSTENLIASKLDNVIDVLLSSDDNNDGVLSRKETDSVLRTLEGLYNSKYNDKLIYQKIEEYGNDMAGILRLINDLFDADPSLAEYKLDN